MPEADRAGLDALGWDDAWSEAFRAGDHPPSWVPARADQAIGRHVSALVGPDRALDLTSRRRDDVAPGDWLVVDPDEARVELILPRRTALVRRSSEAAPVPQVLAANLDIIFVVHSLGAEPNLRRLERELVLAWDSGAVPVVVMSKADLSAYPGSALAAVAAIAPGVEVVPTSTVEGRGVEALRSLLRPNLTGAMLGPSGVGKSTLVNELAGADLQSTTEVRDLDQKGRHTTSAGRLLSIEGGGLLVDTPGLRAVGLWDDGALEGLGAAFPEIDELAADCRFRDCAHETEPGCAVNGAVAAGTLDEARLESWRRLSDELRRLGEDREVWARDRKRAEQAGSRALRAVYDQREQHRR